MSRINTRVKYDDRSVVIDYSRKPCYFHAMANNDWETNWQSVELSEQELEEVNWNQLACEVSGGKMPQEDAITLRKRMIASGYLENYSAFLKNYREQHGELPPREAIEAWHAQNPVDGLVDF